MSVSGWDLPRWLGAGEERESLVEILPRGLGAGDERESLVGICLRECLRVCLRVWLRVSVGIRFWARDARDPRGIAVQAVAVRLRVLRHARIMPTHR